MHATRSTHARRVRPRPAAALLALLTLLAPAGAPAQPLKFETTAPAAPPSDSALSVAERLEKEATGIGASTPSRAAGSALRAFAAALIRRGLADADPPRVLLGITLSRSTSALDSALAANAYAARATAASLAPFAESPPADLAAAEIALRDALAPLAPRAPSDVFTAHLWPTHAAPPVPDLPADAPAPAPIAAALTALRTPDDAPLTLRPRHERLAADARAAAAITAKRPAWMSTAEHASFVSLLQQTLDRAASSPAQDPALSSAVERSLHALALAARAAALTDALDTRDARAARRGWSALFSRTLADPAASLDSWQPFTAGLTEAAPPPPFRDLPAQLRTGARFFSAAAAQSRAQLVGALSRAAADADFQSPALLSARVAHDRRLAELSALATSASVIAAPRKAASKSEPGVLPAFESVARRLRTTGRDLSSSTLRDVAAAQFRDLTRGLSLFHPSAAELSLRSLADGAPSVPPTAGDAPPPESEAAVRRALATLSAGKAPAILATLDAARAAWLKSWESERTAPGRPREQPDPAELQLTRDAAAERLARIAEALDFLYLAAWASASSSPDSLAAPRLTSFPAWDLSPKAAEWIAGELQPAAADVVLTLGEARPEALTASLDQARLRAAPALLAGSLARLLLRSGADPTPRTDLSVVLAEMGAGPPPPDALLLARRADLASICLALEEAAALASKGKASDAEAALKPARALALSLLDAEEFRSPRD